MSNYTISHYYPQEPIAGYWQGLPYFTVLTDGDKTLFRRGKRSWKLLSRDDMKALVEAGQVVELEKWQSIEQDESLFLDPNGMIYIGKKDNIKQDNEKRQIGVLPNIPRWLLNDRVELRGLGIKPSLLLDPDLPEELHVATRQLLARAQVKTQQVLESMKQLFIFSGDSGYETEGEWLNQIRAALRREIKQEIFASTVHTDTRSHFDQLLSWERALEYKVVYLFPFFLTESRSEVWGIIRYAWQRQLAVLIHTSHPCYNASVEADRRIKGEELSYDEIVRMGQKWLVEVVRTSSANVGRGATFRFFQGYIFEELVKEILELHFDRKKMMGFAPMVEPIPKGRDGTRDEAYPKTMNMRDIYDIFFFDPAEALAVEADLKRDHVPDRKVVRIEHGLKIPAGIGYSLPLLRDLLEGRKWLSLLKSVVPIVEELAENLKHSGIEVDHDVLAKVRSISAAPQARNFSK